MNKTVLDLIQYIVWYSTDNGIELTELRLVKFLYLVDLYYAREEKKILTGWGWFFYHFGPYCKESVIYIRHSAKSHLIREKLLQSKFDEESEYRLYSGELDEEEVKRIEKTLPARIESALKSAIRKYGNSSAELLQYVYFGTEPMSHMIPGSTLDFSSSCWPIASAANQQRTVSLSKTKNKRFKELAGELHKAFAQQANQRRVGAIDEAYFEAKACLDQQDALEIEKALVSLSATPLFHKTK